MFSFFYPRQVLFLSFNCSVKRRLTFCALVFVLILGACSKTSSTIKLAEKGVLDLSNWSCDENGSVRLDGEWEFYWGKYLEPNDFQSASLEKDYITVPHRWNQHKIGNDYLPADGYATYRLTIILPESNKVKAFRLSIQNTAYKLWIENDLIVETGKFGMTKESMIPKYLPRTVEYYTDKRQITIILNVSNFHNRFGGIRTSIEFGSSENIKASRERSIALDLFVSGSLFIIGLYYIGIYLLRRKESSALFFAVYALMYSLKSLLEGERFLVHLYPDFPWELDLKISYLVTFSAPAIFGSFLYSLFNAEFQKIVIRIIQFISFILVLIVLFTNARFYSILAIPHQIYLILVGLYASYIFIKAIKHSRAGAKILFIGFIVYFILAAINDSLYSSGMIQSFYMSGYALFLFVLSQGLVLAIRFSNAFLSVERLTTELSKTNKAYSRFIPVEFLKFLKKDKIQDVQLGDQIQEQMTILFADIRSFTTLSESMTPFENFNFINSYLKRINPIIRKNNGFIDKFIGDAVMAIFPHSAEDGVKAAIEIQNEMKVYNEHRRNNGYRPVEIGIGINTGLLMMGTVGDKNRMDTTVIGDTVNLSSRLESLTKEYRVPIIVSEHSVAKIPSLDQYYLREIDVVQVKGKSKPVSIYECFATADSKEIENKTNSASLLMNGLIKFHLGEYEEALENFQKAQLISVDDPIIQMHIDRCKNLIQSKR
ncbi:MAG TPA: adenylate/guanylate cyclase domain-containing protein [Leptospiraceae bacterium]|nr:adenylate/guanylate cyclase domain-containing protein [Leptospiraceae bacterium]HMX32429.1 adenylate/guanylate cyclase domain-containing protein [Leptospiraceae bacterium]HMY33672.1 adenylate/guanylate cyclase domain-containing protein [Leptospiraceae bacterium]HMZ65223.1 adenylate/guanylate cyclase domain-containing protein [Leptospiraceae bacterium]HNA06989.1 adenylate/guanylate cyclase domain-containing protein [Leptospiraceae bacterium]